MATRIDRKEYVRLQRRANKFLEWASTEKDIDSRIHSLAMMIHRENSAARLQELDYASIYMNANLDQSHKLMQRIDIIKGVTPKRTIWTTARSNNKSVKNSNYKYYIGVNKRAIILAIILLLLVAVVL